MSPDTFGDRKLYAIMLGVAILGFVAVKCLAGCGAQQNEVDTAKAEACWERINAKIQASLTCPEAVAGVALVVKEEPTCAVVTHAITLVCHDGGAHD